MNSVPNYSLTKLCTIPVANTWTLISLPNLPVWAAASSWTITPGSLGYYFRITLARGSTNTAPANDTWQSGYFDGAVGQDNFAALPANSVFSIAFAQHEPGPQCSQLMDLDFVSNLRRCQRYYCKSNAYSVLPTTITSTGQVSGTILQGSQYYRAAIRFPVSMAKAPTIVMYGNGANNIMYEVYTTSLATGSTGVSAILGLSLDGFNGVQVASASGGSGQWYGHYTADTGW